MKKKLIFERINNASRLQDFLKILSFSFFFFLRNDEYAAK